MSATPTVYFIDDSATMREVIKIAFRRENINVVACHDAASAFAAIENTRPDVVITDVIMPDKDGYEVCQYIKQNPKFSSTPVILMSGVVNRSVAEKAFSVKADELIRKPFQPQDLIARVRHLLRPAAPAPAAAPSPAAATAALSSIFAASSVGTPGTAAPAGNGGIARKPAAVPMPSAAPAPAQSPLVAAFTQPQNPAPVARAAAAAGLPSTAASVPGAAQPALLASIPAPAAPPQRAAAGTSMDVQKLKFEIMRLETLVKKLQSD